MPLTQIMLEELGARCWQDPALAQDRAAAMRQFFGDDDPRQPSYWPGTGDKTTRERRFIGYFMFQWRLPSGQRAAEFAAEHLYGPDERADVIASVNGSRFVLGAVMSVVDRSVYLQADGQDFEIRSAFVARQLARGVLLAVHLVPVRGRYWLAGPGWVSIPIELTASARSVLTSQAFDPIRFERLLQNRSDQDEGSLAVEDDTLAAAVDRMTRFAEARELPALIRSPDAWSEFVLEYLPAGEVMPYYEGVIKEAGELASADEVNELTQLAGNIWNNTPQPDRDNKTARELSEADRKSGVRRSLRMESRELWPKPPPNPG